MQSNPTREQSGFSLLTLAIWLAGLGLALVLVLALLPNRVDDESIRKTVDTLGDAEDFLLSFVVENGRLPSPDTDGDGLENAGATTGALPYRSMALPTSVLDQASLPLRYTPYRNPAVDLTLIASDLYTPTLPDLSGLQIPSSGNSDPGIVEDFGGGAGGSTVAAGAIVPTLDNCNVQIAPSPLNLLDFCVALDNAIAASTPPVSTSVNAGPSPNENVAYAILSGGREDADGNGADSSLDGLNDDGDLIYEDPAKGRGFGYDDIVRTTRFSTLQRELSCVALVDSVNLLAAVSASGKGVLESALSVYTGAEVQVIMGTVGVLMNIVNIALTIQAGIGIAADIAKASGGCASFVLSIPCCPALAGNIVAAVIYAITAAVQIAEMIVNAVALGEAIVNRNLFRTDIIPQANANLCAAIGATVAADARGGLAPKIVL